MAVARVGIVRLPGHDPALALPTTPPRARRHGRPRLPAARRGARGGARAGAGGRGALVPTGLALEIPPGFEVQLRPRSGLALRQGLTLLNSPGTIDSDYRGEVGVILINHGRRAGR